MALLISTEHSTSSQTCVVCKVNGYPDVEIFIPSELTDISKTITQRIAIRRCPFLIGDNPDPKHDTCSNINAGQMCANITRYNLKW